jgi:NTP-dependent ternary conflict system VMAP-like protein
VSSPIDPARALVLSVGIECYEYGSGMDLPGAASEAARFAQWALNCGIPAERVLLACNWLDAPEALPGGVELIGTSRDVLERAIVDASALDGELLMIFWCGHGILNHHRKRALFTSDASVANKRNIVVEHLLDYLASDQLAGFSQQILIIDACANFIEDMRLGGTLQQSTFDIGRPREVNQFVYFAAAQGQIAAFNRTERHAAFSAAALAWLEQNATLLPPDVVGLVNHVGDVFTKMRESGELRQIPVYRRVRYEGNDDVVDAVPVAGRVQARLRQSGMTVSQIQRVTTKVVDVPQLATPDGRQRLVGRLDDTRHRGSIDEGALADVVTWHLAAGHAQQIFELLMREATTESDKLVVLEVQDCWRRQEWIAPALRSFSTVTRQQVRTAYFKAVPNNDSGQPEDLDEAMDLAAGYARRPGVVAPIHRLAAILEHLTQEKVEDDWYGLPPDRLNALRRQAATSQTRAARLVIDLRNPDAPPDAFRWPDMVTGYLQVPGKGWDSTKVSCEPTVTGAQQAVSRLVEWTNLLGIGAFTMGLIISRAGLDAMPETWTCGDMLEEPTPLWHEWPVMLHSAERLSTPRARAWWGEKAAAIKRRLADEGPEVLWIEPVHRDSPASIRSTVRSTDASCLGLAFAPGGFCQDLRRDPIVAAVAAGAPYVVWTENEPPDWEAVKLFLRKQAAHGAFEDLPIRLHRARIDEADLPDSVLRLIWDEPEALPPFGQLTGIFGRSDGND